MCCGRCSVWWEGVVSTESVLNLPGNFLAEYISYRFLFPVFADFRLLSILNAELYMLISLSWDSAREYLLFKEMDFLHCFIAYPLWVSVSSGELVGR